MSQMFRRAGRLTVPLGFVVLVTSIAGVSAQEVSTEDVCRETQKVRDSYHAEAVRTRAVLNVSRRLNKAMSDLSELEKAVRGGYVMSKMEDVILGWEALIKTTLVTAEMLPDTTAERLSLQSQFYSGFKGLVDEAALADDDDELVQKYDRLASQIELRDKRLTGLKCDEVTSRQPKAAGIDISGSWKYAKDWVYNITQDGPRFSWTLGKFNEKGEGKLTGASISASWSGTNGSASAKGTVITDAGGKAIKIVWNNGVTFTRP